MTIIVVAALVVGIVTAVWPSAEPTVDVTVGPGETLLSIALHDMPDRDPADAVRAIEELNGVSGPQVAPGVVLRIPAQ